MKATSLELDPSGRVPMTLRQGKSFGFTMTFPTAITGTWEIVFCRDEAGKDIVMRFTLGSGFTIAGNVLTCYCSVANNKLKVGACYVRISCSSGSASVLAFTGPVTVRP